MIATLTDSAERVLIALITAASVITVGFFNYRATRSVRDLTTQVDAKVDTTNGHTLGKSAQLVEDLLHTQGRRIDSVEVQVRESAETARGAVDTAVAAAAEAALRASEASEAARDNHQQLGVINTKVDGLHALHEAQAGLLHEHTVSDEPLVAFVKQQMLADEQTDDG